MGIAVQVSGPVVRKVVSLVHILAERKPRNQKGQRQDMLFKIIPPPDLFPSANSYVL